MISVILDTNFLLLPFEQKFQALEALEGFVDESHELVVPGCVMKELEGLSAGGNRDARAALELVKLKNLKILKEESQISCDDAILDFAASVRGIVCTLDAELIRRARQSQVRVITKGKGKYLREVV